MAAPHQEEVPGLLDRSAPWTEQDWLDLPEHTNAELVDGALVMSPRASNPHQKLVLRIGALLDAAAPPTISVLPEPNVRLSTDRLLVPDLAVVRNDHRQSINEAQDVDLVVEIVSPGNAAVDRVLKPRLYAEAGIRWYLRVEQDGPVGHLHDLVDGGYQEVARGPVLEITEPVAATLDLPHLAR